MLILSVGQKLIYVPFLFCLVLVLLLRLEIFANGVWGEFYHWKILLHMVLLYQGKIADFTSELKEMYIQCYYHKKYSILFKDNHVYYFLNKKQVTYQYLKKC